MTAVVPATPPPAAEDFMRPRLRRWTPGELRRMTQAGFFLPDDSAELIEGEVYEGGQIHLWTSDEYHRLGDSGLLPPGERTELLQRRIVRKVTMNPPHSSVVWRVLQALRSVFGTGFVISGQSPLSLSTDNDPEPDAMVAVGELADYDGRHPAPGETLLVVEVSDTTLGEDRLYKSGLYAGGDINDYWIVNINARTLEVRRQPRDGAYQSVSVHDEGDAVAPLAAPASPVRAADLLPLRRPNAEPEG